MSSLYGSLPLRPCVLSPDNLGPYPPASLLLLVNGVTNINVFLKIYSGKKVKWIRLRGLVLSMFLLWTKKNKEQTNFYPRAIRMDH